MSKTYTQNTPEVNAGYEIIAKETYHTDKESFTSNYGIALGRRKTTDGYAWVTWEYTEIEGEEPSYYWGHYHDGNEQKARADYHTRIAAGYDRQVS